jgi:hypothetical protein
MCASWNLTCTLHLAPVDCEAIDHVLQLAEEELHWAGWFRLVVVSGKERGYFENIEIPR